MRKRQKLELAGLLLALSLSVSMAGCTGNDYTVNKDYKADPIELDLSVDTFDPVYLEGFMYPYYYNMVDFTTEPETKNIVTETDFMGRYYPYSYALYEGDDAAQEFYRRVIDAVYSMEETIDCTDLNLSADTANTIFRQIVLEIPEFYYLDSTYNYKLTNNYTVSTVTLTYNLTREEVSAYNAVLYDVTQSVKSAVPRSISRYDLYVWLHDFVVLNVAYDEGDNIEHATDIIGAFIEHRGNCQAFAAAFEFLCRQFNITTCLVTGDVGLPHIWNIVPYGDDWFHIDVGMDNVDSETAPDYVNHNFVMVSDDWIVTTAKHTIYEGEEDSQLYELPKCANDSMRFDIFCMI